MGKIVDRRKTITAAGWSLPALVTTLAVPAARASSTTSGTRPLPWAIERTAPNASITFLVSRDEQVCFRVSPQGSTADPNALPSYNLNVTASAAGGETVEVLDPDNNPVSFPIVANTAGDYCFHLGVADCPGVNDVTVEGSIGAPGFNSYSAFWNGNVGNPFEC